MGMKYVVLHGEGLADRPHPNLQGKTPLQVAGTPNMDFLARNGEFGLLAIPAEGLTPGSDLTELAMLGQDPRKSYPGPAPFDAAGLGVALGDQDVAVRCHMVTLRSAQGGRGAADLKKLGANVILEDETAGGIQTEEARELIDAINEQLGSEVIQFYPGTGHRHVMVWVGGKARITCHAPHDVKDKPVADFLPTGEGSEILRQVMEASLVILRDHPVNGQREKEGLKPANCLWLWGQGRATRLPSLTERFNVTGAIVSPSELHRGIGICLGLEGVAPTEGTEPGAVPYRSVAEAALSELEKKDFVYVHVGMPVDMAEEESKAKLKLVEDFDRDLVGTLLGGLSKLGAHRVALACDHSGQQGPPSGQGGMPPALFTLYQGPVARSQDGARGFNEADAMESQTKLLDATKLMARLFRKG